MSTVIIDNQEHAVEVRLGDKLFFLALSGEGSLFIEAPDGQPLKFIIADDDDLQVTAVGSWINIDYNGE